MSAQSVEGKEPHNTNMVQRMIKWILIIIVVVAIGGLLAYNTIAYGTLPLGSWGRVGEPAPTFKLASLSGSDVDLQALQGQPVVLSFGTSWCTFCQREVSFLQSVHEKYPDLDIVFVSVEEESDVVQNFVNENGLTFDVLLDIEGETARNYGVLRYPSLFFISGEGLVHAHMNRELPLDEFETYLSELGVNLNS